METTNTLQITHKTLCLSFECPIELHHVKATARIMVRVGKYDNPSDPKFGELWLDVDDTEYENIEFLGKIYPDDYETYKKFTTSFKELTGIDIISEFDDYLELNFPKETLLNHLIETNNLNL
jgi:hypothetical protein